MKVFRIVADSSCLIALAQIELFGLLQEVFSKIYIPRAVYEEVVVKGRGEPGSGEAEAALKDGWILMKDVNDRTAIDALKAILGKGESEVIILCKELRADYALIDERTARHRAELMSVDTMGVLGIMDLAIEMGFTIDKRSLVKQLKAVGFRISDKLYKRMFGDLK
jgi:predicted nucleic acid-binding protein